MGWSPLFESTVAPDGRRRYRLGHELVDEFLEFAAGRCRPNTVRAYAHDLKAFFDVVDKDPGDVTSRDVLAFVGPSSSLGRERRTLCGWDCQIRGVTGLA